MATKALFICSIACCLAYGGLTGSGFTGWSIANFENDKLRYANAELIKVNKQLIEADKTLSDTNLELTQKNLSLVKLLGQACSKVLEDGANRIEFLTFAYKLTKNYENSANTSQIMEDLTLNLESLLREVALFERINDEKVIMFCSPESVDEYNHACDEALKALSE